MLLKRKTSKEGHIYTIFYCFICSLLILTLTVSNTFGQEETDENRVLNVTDTLAPIINYDMLRMFEKFKDKGTITEMVYLKLLLDPQNATSERWRQLLEEYYGAIAIGEDPLEQEEFVELVGEEVDLYISEKEAASNQHNVSTSLPDSNQYTGSPVDDIENHSMVNYHIQIAASTQPLEETYLNKLYKGNEEIHQFTEEGWEKYFVGNFSRFAEAREALRNVGVRGAFIIAFVGGEKVIAYKARAIEKSMNASPLQTFHHDEQVSFRVQIAASKTPLTEPEIEKLFPDRSSIGLIYEDNWYKYSIPAAETLSDSWKIARQTGIEGAYVVKYQRGKRLPLR